MIGVQQTASDGSCACARSIQMQRHDAAFARLAVLDIDGTLTDTVALHQAAMLAVMWSTFGPDYRTFSERFGCAFARDGVGARDARGIVTAAIMAAISRHGGSPDRIVSVGDGLWDLKTAEALGLSFLGIGTGENALVLSDRGGLAWKRIRLMRFVRT